MTIKLKAPPKDTPYLMADYLEICVAMGEYEALASSDVSSIINEDSLVEEDNADPTLSTAEINFNKQIQIEEWYEHFQYRTSAFNSSYPFKLEGSTLKRKSKKWSNKHYLYLFLLFCSSLRIFKKPTQVSYAALFEKLSAETTKILWSSASVKIFSPGSTDRKKFFGTRLYDAVNKLAEYLNESVSPICERDLPSLISGDGGIDIVAHYPWKDSASGPPIWLGQCASKGDNWKSKKSDADNFKGLITFSDRPANMLFIPGCFRAPSGEWFNKIDAFGCILIDRLRICRSLEKHPPTKIFIKEIKKLVN